jgi:hypothetical protein
MSPTPGSSDYRSTSNQTAPSPTEAVFDQVEEAAQDPGAFASEIVGAIKERPYGTMALAGICNWRVVDGSASAAPNQLPDDARETSVPS